jgi:hypothetical protein
VKEEPVDIRSEWEAAHDETDEWDWSWALVCWSLALIVGAELGIIVHMIRSV